MEDLGNEEKSLMEDIIKMVIGNLGPNDADGGYFEIENSEKYKWENAHVCQSHNEN